MPSLSGTEIFRPTPFFFLPESDTGMLNMFADQCCGSETIFFIRIPFSAEFWIPM
jgi:hypothetical protein